MNPFFRSAAIFFLAATLVWMLPAQALATNIMPVVSGLSTPTPKGAIAATAATPRTASTPPAVVHDCVILYMGAGGDFFASAIRHQAENARRRFPKAIVEVRYHFDARPLPATCRNPLFVGHSMGAIRAVKQGNKHKRGRVISIDPPNWHTLVFGLEATVPTVNFYHCPPSPFGCGLVKGARNIDISDERRGHVLLPYSPRVTREVQR